MYKKRLFLPGFSLLKQKQNLMPITEKPETVFPCYPVVLISPLICVLPIFPGLHQVEKQPDLYLYLLLLRGEDSNMGRPPSLGSQLPAPLIRA